VLIFPLAPIERLSGAAKLSNEPAKASAGVFFRRRIHPF